MLATDQTDGIQKLLQYGAGPIGSQHDALLKWVTDLVLGGRSDAEVEVLWDQVICRTAIDPARGPWTHEDLDKLIEWSRNKLKDEVLSDWQLVSAVKLDAGNQAQNDAHLERLPDFVQQLINDGVADRQVVLRQWSLDQYREAKAAADFDPPILRSLADVLADPKPDWVIPNWLPVGVIGLAGPTEAGKSLLARDWLNVCANGGTWFGQQVEQCNVTYVLGEGLFDLDVRFDCISLERIAIFTEPVNLLDMRVVNHFIEQHEGLGTRLVIFDTIYDMGLPDDNGVKDVAPLLSSCKRISANLKAAVVVIGHPGHDDTRKRFRGSSMWRQRFDVEFHMSIDAAGKTGLLTCEKAKYFDKRRGRTKFYEVEFPELKWSEPSFARLMDHPDLVRERRIEEELDLYPEETVAAMARRLAPEFGMSTRQIERLIKKVKKRLLGED